MKFYLVKDREISLPTEAIFDSFYTRSITIPVDILSGGEGFLSDGDCQKLETILKKPSAALPRISGTSKCLPEQSNAHTEETKGEKLNWNVVLTLGINASGGNCRDFIKLEGTEKGSIFEDFQRIREHYGLKLNLVVELKHFTYTKTNNPSTTETVEYVVTRECEVDEIFGGVSGKQGSQLHWSGYMNHGFWHPNTLYAYTAVLTISGTLCPETSNLDLERRFAPINHIINTNHIILDKELYCDAAIISKDSVSTKCHKSFLAAHSPVFETMFKDNFEEGKTSTVEIPDMTEAGVKALLAYLYYMDDKEPSKHSSVAIELFIAGHKYDISSLEQSMEALLLSKPDNWFEVEVAMKLFLFARNLSDGEKLKTRAIKLLKLNYASLKTSSSYKELFRENPEAAMDLCELLLTPL